jgi:pimeloyl-ACP methyl ester carboxylesterase
MAPAANLTALADGIKDSAVGKIISSYIAESWSAVYGFDLDAVVSPGYPPIIRSIAQKCFENLDALANVLTGTQLSGRIFRDSAMDGRMGRLLEDNTPIGRITAPVLIAQGEADQLVLPEVQREFVADWCSEGQEIDFRTYPGLDHLPLVAADSPLTSELVAWARARLAGEPATPNC